MITNFIRNYYKDVNIKKIQLVKDGIPVYRMSNTFDFNKYGKGSQFYFSSFVSTSLEESIKEKFYGKCFMRIIIKNNEKNNYCYLIENVSDCKHEKEVLITAYCQFLITNISKDEKGLDIIDMECLGYVFDDKNPKKWPKENENIISQYTNEDIGQNETYNYEEGCECNLI